MRNTVAKTITSQIGGKALYMIGAKQFISTQYGVNFKIMKNEKKVNMIQIKLNEKDLYDVSFYKVWGTKFEVLSTENDIYDNMLTGSIRRNTGLNTNL